MADAGVLKPPGEDDEAWLYGEKANQISQAEPTAPGETNEVPEAPKDTEAGELSDDDESDDDIQVTIGDIKTGPQDSSRNLFKTGASAYQKGTPVAAKPGKGVDVEAQGIIDNQATLEFDIDKLNAEDKPWRKPGADITDYFNYGFNEDTWKQYCEKQRRMRLESGGKSISYINQGAVSSLAVNQQPQKTLNSSLVTLTSHNRRAGPPPARKATGTIDVISTVTSRRADDVQIVSSSLPPTNTFNESFPNTSIPPPGLAPPSYGPPPSAFSMPPPGIQPSGPPTYGAPPPMPYYPQVPPVPAGISPSGPPPNFVRPPPPSFGGPRGPPPPNFGGPPPSQPRYGGPVGVYPQYHGNVRPDSYYDSSSDSESERYGAKKPKTEPIDTGYERQRYPRDRSPIRDRNRGRSPSRSRETRQRDRSGDRDRHRRRRHREDEDDHRKHRRSRRPKKEREEDGGGGDSASSQTAATNQLDGESAS